jgi:hypothetical protein
VLVADYFFSSDLNETPNRIATLRMRLGLRCMIRAASSKDFAPHDDLQRIIRERPLQRLRLIPRRAHPNVALFIGR